MPDPVADGRVASDQDGFAPLERANDARVPGGALASGLSGPTKSTTSQRGDAEDGVTPDVEPRPAKRDDGKDADAFRTIGEVTRALGLAPHVLRYWEEQFPMLRPVKRSGGRRLYRPSDIALLEDIHRLVHKRGYTLRGARQYLEDRERPANQAPDLLSGLIALRADLARLLKD